MWQPKTFEDHLLQKYLEENSGKLFLEVPVDKLFFIDEDVDCHAKFKKSDFNYNGPYEIKGLWDIGYTLDKNTIKSKFNSDGSINITRSYIHELLYSIKYCFDKTKIHEIAVIIITEMEVLFHEPIHVIIPIPPSVLNRPFQPVIELVQTISELSEIPCNLKYLCKKSDVVIKTIKENTKKGEILKNAFTLLDNCYEGKTVLLIDDHICSGATLNSATILLKKKGNVEKVYVLTIS